MPITVNQIVRGHLGGTRNTVLADVTFDNSYTSGGEPVKGSDLGLFALDGLLVIGQSTAGFVPQWDSANRKLQVFQSAAISEELSGDAETLEVAAGPLEEVDGDDVEDLVVKVLAIGS